MNTEEFLSHLISNDELVPKRCTESYLKNHNLLSVLDELTSKDFGSISDRIKLLKYGGGYCEVCGIRTKISVTGKGFGKYCKDHFHEPKKNIPAHNRKDFDINLAIKYYNEDKLSLVEIAKLFNVSNVTLANRFKENNIEIRKSTGNTHTDNTIANNVNVKLDDKLHISPYLSEKNIYQILSFVYGESSIKKQVRIKDNDRIFIVDYTVSLPNNELMIVEFNGYHHYTDTKTIIRDYALREYCYTNNIKLVEIPYFVQLFNHNFSKYFGCNIDKEITTNQPSGFIIEKIVLPYDYCSLGVTRFMDDISENDKTTDEILLSLRQRKPEEVKLLKGFEDSLEDSYSRWHNYMCIFY